MSWTILLLLAVVVAFNDDALAALDKGVPHACLTTPAATMNAIDDVGALETMAGQLEKLENAELDGAQMAVANKRHFWEAHFSNSTAPQGPVTLLEHVEGTSLAEAEDHLGEAQSWHQFYVEHQWHQEFSYAFEKLADARDAAWSHSWSQELELIENRMRQAFTKALGEVGTKVHRALAPLAAGAAVAAAGARGHARSSHAAMSTIAGLAYSATPATAVKYDGTLMSAGKPTSQSSTKHGGSAPRAVDGNSATSWGGGSCTHTTPESDPFWRVDLEQQVTVNTVKVVNRGDCCGVRLNNFEVKVGNTDAGSDWQNANSKCGDTHSVAQGSTGDVSCAGLVGRYVFVGIPGSGTLTLCEVEVNGSPPDTCTSLGYIDGTTNTWTAGLWSRDIPVGLLGNSERMEKYQVPPPSCPEQCHRENVTSVVDPLAQDTATEEDAGSLPLVTVSAGDKYNCALSQWHKPKCWGTDDELQADKGTQDYEWRKSPNGGDRLVSDIDFATIEAGLGRPWFTCGLELGTKYAVCFGKPIQSRDDACAGIDRSTAFSSVSVGEYSACFIEEATSHVKCCGSNRYGEADVPKTAAGADIQFSSISCGLHHTCGIEKDTKTAICWGEDDRGQVSGIPSNTAFSSIKAGGQWAKSTCGIVEDTKHALCWGDNARKLNEPPADTRFTEITRPGSMHVCGIVEGTRQLQCWGADSNGTPEYAGQMTGYKYGNTADAPQGTPPGDKKFSSISAGMGHTCGVVEDTQALICWGESRHHQGFLELPKGTVLVKQPSCQTQHPAMQLLSSCTSCNPMGPNPHFTIMDPKSNTGTCTATACPTCKPAACCGAHHKHYVLNTENLEGVCVRHTDDCTPVCVPRGDNEPSKRRVCSKGCNQLLKVVKNTCQNTHATIKGPSGCTSCDPNGLNPTFTVQDSSTQTGTCTGANTETDLYDMVVCQADKRVVCDPTWNDAESRYDNTCAQTGSFKAVAMCKFSPDLWNLGGTCLTNHVHGDEIKNCPDEAPEDLIVSITSGSAPVCREPTDEDHAYCARLGMSY